MSDNTANHSETRREDWSTPQELFNKLNSVFNFSFDLAADETNRKTDFYVSEKMDLMSDNTGIAIDSLTEDDEYFWMNPPYKSHGGTGKYVQRAVDIAGPRGLVILIPVSAGSAWWKKHVWPHFQTFIWPRRFPFEGAGDNAKFDCAICVRWNSVYFRDETKDLISLDIGPVTQRLT